MKPIARELMKLFFQKPRGEFSHREVERETGFSIGTVSTYISQLKKDDLVKTRPVGRSIVVKANLENPLFVHMKRAYNLELVYSSGLVEYLTENLRPDTIILFGSYSKGEDDEESDIDVAAVNGRDIDLNLEKFEKIFERKINLVKIKSLDKTPKEFLNTLANGIVLSGSIEVIK